MADGGITSAGEAASLASVTMIPKDLLVALIAIAQGYPGRVAADRFIIVENPTFQEDNGQAPTHIIDIADYTAR